MKYNIKIIKCMLCLLILMSVTLTACQRNSALPNHVTSEKMVYEVKHENDFVSLNYNEKTVKNQIVNKENLDETIKLYSTNFSIGEEKVKWLESLWENMQKQNDEMIFSLGDEWLQFDKEKELVYFDGKQITKIPDSNKGQQLRVCKGYDEAFKRTIIVIALGNYTEDGCLSGEGTVYGFSKTPFEGGYFTDESKYIGHFEKGNAQGEGKYEKTNNYFNIPGISGKDYQAFEGIWNEGAPAEGISKLIYNRRAGLETSAATLKGKFEGKRYDYKFVNGFYEYNYVNEDTNSYIEHTTISCDVEEEICKNWKVQSDVKKNDGLNEGSSAASWPMVLIDDCVVDDNVNIKYNNIAS